MTDIVGSVVGAAAKATPVGEVIGFLDDLARLGATPAVQQAVLAYIAKQQGIPQAQLDADIQAARETSAPKEE